CHHPDRARQLPSLRRLCGRFRAAFDRRAGARALDRAGAGMSGVRQQVVARDEDGMRLDRWSATHFPQLTCGHLQKLLRSGQVRVDSGRVKTSTRLAAGQMVRIPPITAAPAAPTVTVDSKEVDYLRGLILYEDDDI